VRGDETLIIINLTYTELSQGLVYSSASSAVGRTETSMHDED